MFLLIGGTEQELRICPCKSNRVVYVREDILELEAVSRKFEQDVCLYKERNCIGPCKEAEISDTNVERVPNLGTTLDFGNSKAGSSGVMTVDGANSSAAVSISTSSAHNEAPKHSEAKVGLLTMY